MMLLFLIYLGKIEAWQRSFAFTERTRAPAAGDTRPIRGNIHVTTVARLRRPALKGDRTFA